MREARESLVSSRAIGRARESLVTPPKQIPVLNLCQAHARLVRAKPLFTATPD